MTKQIDKNALTKWTKSNISYNNYQEFINKKSDRFKLSLIDLLYISNFKGGNATINEPEKDIECKLQSYSKLLIAIHNKFNGKALQHLEENEIEELIKLINSICDMTHKNTKTRIDGFSVSYLSALLNSYFPILIPILDRRVLINLSLVKKADIDNYGQIKNIQNFYTTLINKFMEVCKKEKINVRELDKILFSTKLIQPDV